MPRFARIFLFQSLRARICRRGATLVELAIVLVVVGILMGGALIPMRALEERRQLREEMRQMERVRNAIVGYAFRHRTKARTLRIVPVLRRSPVVLGFVSEFRLPAGRPYLPCPDWDGDGFEDRLPAGAEGFMQGMEVKSDLTVTIRVGVPRDGAVFPIGDDILSWVDPSLEWTGTHPYGACAASRGAVPWRTLGVPPADRWGGRHTYFADPLFSSSIFGFDRQTIADIYDRRIPDAPGLRPPERFSSSVTGRTYQYEDTELFCPAVICDGGRAQNCWQNRHRDFSKRCLWNPDRVDGLALKAGAVARDDIFSASPGGREFPKGAVTDGLPLVLVSHGPNGHFAVNHWATLHDPIHPVDGVKSPICNLGPASEIDVVAQPGHLGRVHEAANGTRIAPGHKKQFVDTPRLPTDRCVRLFGVGPEFSGGRPDIFNLSSFVWEPPGEEFDDLLLWMTREELSVAVPGDIPPLPRMIIPFFPL